jgi:hypothetical protein
VGAILVTVALLAGCQPDTNQPAKEVTKAPVTVTPPTPPTASVKPAPEVPKEKKPIKVSLSGPKPVDGIVSLQRGKPLSVRGWWISDNQPRALRVKMNDKVYTTEKEDRADVEKKYTDYTYKSGFTCAIPPEDLKEGVLYALEIQVAKKITNTKNFKIKFTD